MQRRRVVKNKRKTVLRISALLGALALIIAGGVAVYMLLKRTPSLPRAALNELPFSANDKYVFTGGGFLYEKEGTLYNDDFVNDKKDYSLSIGEGDFALAGSADIQLIYNNKEFLVVGQDFPKETAGVLQSLKCGTAFVAALRADGTNSENERIQLYDATGAMLLDGLSEDRFIVDYGFYNAQSEYLYIISMMPVGATPVSTITLYNASRVSTSGVISVQNQLIEHLRFTRNGIFAIGTNQIIRYSLTDNRESYRSTVYGWKLIDYDASGQNPAFLLMPRTAEALGTLKLLTLSDDNVPNESHRMLLMPSGAIGAYLMSTKIVALTRSGYILYDLTGKQTGEYAFEDPIDSAYKLDSSTLLIKSGAAYYTLKIA